MIAISPTALHGIFNSQYIPDSHQFQRTPSTKQIPSKSLGISRLAFALTKGEKKPTITRCFQSLDRALSGVEASAADVVVVEALVGEVGDLCRP